MSVIKAQVALFFCFSPFAWFLRSFLTVIQRDLLVAFPFIHPRSVACHFVLFVVAVKSKAWKMWDETRVKGLIQKIHSLSPSTESLGSHDASGIAMARSSWQDLRRRIFINRKRERIFIQFKAEFREIEVQKCCSKTPHEIVTLTSWLLQVVKMSCQLSCCFVIRLTIFHLFPLKPWFIYIHFILLLFPVLQYVLYHTRLQVCQTEITCFANNVKTRQSCHRKQATEIQLSSFLLAQQLLSM